MPKHDKNPRHGGTRNETAQQVSPLRGSSWRWCWWLPTVIIVLIPRGGLPAAVDVARAYDMYKAGALHAGCAHARGI